MKLDLSDIILIDGLTQSSKTWKFFNLLDKHLNAYSNTLVLFITQANCVRAANQVISRAKAIPELRNKFQKIERNDNCFQYEHQKNVMYVDFFNTRNTNVFRQIVSKKRWDNIIICVDEVDQGGKIGLKNRIHFIQQIEQICKNIHLVFITATIANLSKNILCIAQNYDETFKENENSIIYRLLYNSCIEHQYVLPSDQYIGPSWYVNLNAFEEVDYNSNAKEIHVRNASKIEAIVNKFKNIQNHEKQLALIVASTNIIEQNKLTSSLLCENTGFNVIVLLNSCNGKNYDVVFRTDDEKNRIQRWQIPYNELETIADKNKLSYFREGYQNIKTDIINRYDLSLSIILQSSLCMGTTIEKDIQSKISSIEYTKLKCINQALCCFVKNKRPLCYPNMPKIAIVAGHLASRGITIQNPFIDFVFTSFCFLGDSDKVQQGAQNAQKFGRACGMLGPSFVKRMPRMIVSNCIINDALANEHSFFEACQKYDKKMFLLSDLVTQKEWKKTLKTSKKIINESKSVKIKETDELSKKHKNKRLRIEIMSLLLKHPNGLSRQNIKELDAYMFEQIASQHDYVLNYLKSIKCIDKNQENKWILTNKGKEYLSKE